MARERRIVPDETVLLCEGCGYVVSGLPVDGNCPECGKPIAESVGSQRQMTEFERQPNFKTFCQTTLRLLAAPTRFYQTLQTRMGSSAAERFAHRHRLLAAMLFAAAGVGHYGAVYGPGLRPSSWEIELRSEVEFWLILSVLTWWLLAGINRLATWLSVIESRYWGMRLPHQVVRRGMAFHAADYLPVGIIAVAIVWGYRLLLTESPEAHRFDMYYLYTLCGFVIVAAAYLFKTYWIGMRNMMWANR